MRTILLLCEALEEALIIADRVDGVLAEQVTAAFDRADTLCQMAMRRPKLQDTSSTSSTPGHADAPPCDDKTPQRKWLAEADRRLRDLHLAGVAVPEMAMLFDREESAIRRRLSTLGLMTRPITRSGAHVGRRSSRRSA